MSPRCDQVEADDAHAQGSPWILSEGIQPGSEALESGGGTGVMNEIKIIEVKESVFADNNADAQRLRDQLKEEKNPNNEHILC